MDGKHVKAHLSEWSDQERIVAAHQVKALLEHPGWEYVWEAVRLYERAHIAAQIASPKENVSEYAHAAGHIKGLREIDGIAKGVVEAGVEAEKRLREQERTGATHG